VMLYREGVESVTMFVWSNATRKFMRFVIGNEYYITQDYYIITKNEVKVKSINFVSQRAKQFWKLRYV
jgi:hypothetical protein